MLHALRRGEQCASGRGFVAGFITHAARMQRSLQGAGAGAGAAATSPRKGKIHGGGGDVDSMLEGWETSVGLEIHAQVSSASKAFSSAPVAFAAVPNTMVAPFDAASELTKLHTCCT